ncbi:hypothetical protein VTN77DRAFT_4149 [Rasamsonia byssochlamydoides]|uniref:uncharacterized protein n=1 Tax=Rasamsonia byssochlamydoides TaxID=89139 RepID=UPI0037426921
MSHPDSTFWSPVGLSGAPHHKPHSPQTGRTPSAAGKLGIYSNGRLLILLMDDQVDPVMAMAGSPPGLWAQETLFRALAPKRDPCCVSRFHHHRRQKAIIPLSPRSGK